MDPSDSAMQAAEPTLLDVMSCAGAWGDSLIADRLGARARLMFSLASKGCQQRVWDAAKQATVTLLAYCGIRDAVWQRRLASAEQGLAARGPQRRNELVMRLPSPNPAALQSLLSVSAAAGRAVTELEVHQLPSSAPACEGVYTPWLQALPAAFPNLRTLSINRLCGCLPPPAQMPQLRQLYVTVIDDARTQCSVQQICSSIAPHTPRLTSLSLSYIITQRTERPPWHHLFTTPSTTLTHFYTSETLSDGLTRLLLKYAPSVEYLQCSGVDDLPQDCSQAVWAVKKLWTRGLEVSGLVSLPQNPNCPLTVPGCVLWLEVEAGGLPQAVRDRLPSWRLTSRSCMMLDIHEWTRPDSIRRALQQLSSLPRGVLNFNINGLHCLAPCAEAIAATAPALAHLKVFHPDVVGDNESVAELLRYGDAVRHASFDEVMFDRHGGFANTPWPWQSLDVSAAMRLSDILWLPDPCGGQYKLELFKLHAESKMDPTELAELERRLQHLTLVTPVIYLCPFDKAPHQQPAALRQLLKLLSKAKWCAGQHGLTVQLEGWALTPALLQELTLLPCFKHAVRLGFRACQWLAPLGSFEQLAGYVPACYSTWVLHAPDRWQTQAHPCTAQHVLAVCKGARARGGGSRRLRVEAPHSIMRRDEERSLVHKCIDEEGLGRWVELEVN